MAMQPSDPQKVMRRPTLLKILNKSATPNDSCTSGTVNLYDVASLNRNRRGLIIILINFLSFVCFSWGAGCSFQVYSTSLKSQAVWEFEHAAAGSLLPAGKVERKSDIIPYLEHLVTTMQALPSGVFSDAYKILFGFVQQRRRAKGKSCLQDLPESMKTMRCAGHEQNVSRFGPPSDPEKYKPMPGRHNDFTSAPVKVLIIPPYSWNHSNATYMAAALNDLKNDNWLDQSTDFVQLCYYMYCSQDNSIVEKWVYWEIDVLSDKVDTLHFNYGNIDLKNYKFDVISEASQGIIFIYIALLMALLTHAYDLWHWDHSARVRQLLAEENDVERASFSETRPRKNTLESCYLRIRKCKAFYSSPYQFTSFVTSVIAPYAMYVVWYDQVFRPHMTDHKRLLANAVIDPQFLHSHLESLFLDANSTANLYQEIIQYSPGILCVWVIFFAMSVRALQALQFHTGMGILTNVIYFGGHWLVNFFAAFVIFLYIFATLGYVQLGIAGGADFQSLIASFETTLQIAFGVYDVSDLDKRDNTLPGITQVYFYLIVFFVLLIAPNVLLAIVGDAFESIHDGSVTDGGVATDFQALVERVFNHVSNQDALRHLRCSFIESVADSVEHETEYQLQLNAIADSHSDAKSTTDNLSKDELTHIIYVFFLLQLESVSIHASDEEAFGALLRKVPLLQWHWKQETEEMRDMLKPVSIDESSEEDFLAKLKQCAAFLAKDICSQHLHVRFSNGQYSREQELASNRSYVFKSIVESEARLRKAIMKKKI